MVNQLNPEQLLNQNFAAISQAKQRTGDWEKAFQQVTGQSWPKGQNIKIGPQGGQMVKDTGGWKSVLGKALPVAAMVAAPFTGGASMAAMLGAGAGAAKGALTGGGWKGALKGGLTGAASGYGASKLGGLLGKVNPVMHAGEKGGGSFLRDAVNGVGKKMVDGYGEDFVGPTLEQAGLKGGGGNWLQKFMGGAKKVIGAGGAGDGDPGEGGGAQGWADASSMFGSLGQAEASNRFAKAGLTQNYDRLNMEAGAQNRAQESDALKKLAQTSYIMGGGAKPLPTQINSGTLPNLGFGPSPASAAQQQGASTLQGTLLNRLTPEGQMKPTDPSTYLKEGKLENIGKWGGIATGGLGAAKTILGW